MTQGDVGLVRRAQAGDQAAFVAIYEQYQPPVYTYVYYRVGEAALAEDLTAEVFVRLVDKIHTFTPGERPILAWLYTIAGNLITDHYRHNGRVTLLPLDEERDVSEVDPAQLAQSHLAQEKLLAAMRQLTEEQRQVVLLKFVDRRSNAEVGAILGKSEGAIKALQHRALAALRRALVEEQEHERA